MRYIKLLIYSLLYIITILIAASAFLLKPHPFNSPLLAGIRIVIVCFAGVLLAKYTLYMLLAPWYRVMAARRKKERVSHYQPLVSVMIPAWNEEIGLLNTVKSLLKSTYPRLELVIVNDGSTDSSDAMMRDFLEKYERHMAPLPEQDRIQITYYYQHNGGKGSALNTAIKLAHGAILVSIDADCLVDSHAIEAFVSAFADPFVMAAVGNVRIGNTRTLVGMIQYLEYMFGFYFKKADSLLNTIYIIGGAAGAFRREVFQRLGGYSTKNITEDIELSIRIQEQGWHIVYCPDVLVYTEGASTLQGLMKQRLRWKRGRFQTFIEHHGFFFSLRPQHNKLLTCIVLPLAIFGDVQLGFELLFIAVLYVFSFLSGDFSAFISGILVVSLMFAIQAWDARHEQQAAYLLLAPIGWLLFYAVTFVEVYALAKSLWMMLRRREATWQKWSRKGVNS